MRRAATITTLILATAVLVILAPMALATTCDVTEFPSSGTLTAERLNQRVRQTEACVNGQIGNGNWNATQPLAVTNLQNRYALFATTWTLEDADGDTTAGEDIAVTADIKQWRVPVSATVVGMSVTLRCPSDVTGTAGDCAEASVTLTLQKGTTGIKTFSGLNNNTPNVDFALGNTITGTDVLNLDVAGTLTDIDYIDVVVYYEAQHQS